MDQSANLKNKTIFGMVWAAVQRFGIMILSFVSNLILARLLSPDDFGAIGMLAIFIALSTNFIDGGFGSALVQKTNPTQKVSVLHIKTATALLPRSVNLKRQL